MYRLRSIIVRGNVCGHYREQACFPAARVLRLDLLLLRDAALGWFKTLARQFEGATRRGREERNPSPKGRAGHGGVGTNLVSNCRVNDAPTLIRALKATVGSEGHDVERGRAASTAVGVVVLCPFAPVSPKVS